MLIKSLMNKSFHIRNPLLLATIGLTIFSRLKVRVRTLFLKGLGLVAIFLTFIPAAFTQSGSAPWKILAQLGHQAVIRGVAFSPDGRFVVSGSEDHTLKLWDVKTGRELRTFIGHANWITSVAFSPA